MQPTVIFQHEPSVRERITGEYDGGFRGLLRLKIDRGEVGLCRPLEEKLCQDELKPKTAVGDGGVFSIAQQG